MGGLAGGRNTCYVTAVLRFLVVPYESTVATAGFLKVKRKTAPFVSCRAEPGLGTKRRMPLCFALR